MVYTANSCQSVVVLVLISSLAADVPVKPRYNLTLCSMMRNEMPDILEWIEHYRNQGVDRFILYDDDSTDDTVLVPTLYYLRGLEDLVTFYPANPYRKNILPPHTGQHYLDKEVITLQHCGHLSAHVSEWVIVVDVDEFVYAPTHPTIWAFLESESVKNKTSDQVNDNPQSQFHILPFRHGTSGLQLNFIGTMDFNPLSDSVTVSVSNPNTDDPAYPLFTELNSNRCPDKFLDHDYWLRYNETCRDNDEYREYCFEGHGKSIWKPERCDYGHIHSCGLLTKGYADWANINDLRMNHYALKSRAHVDGLLGDIMKPAKLKELDLDESWFSSRSDPMPQNVIELIKNGLNEIMSNSS